MNRNKQFKKLKTSRWILGQEIRMGKFAWLVQCKHSGKSGWIPFACVNRPHRNFGDSGVTLFLAKWNFTDLKKFKRPDFEKEIQPFYNDAAA